MNGGREKEGRGDKREKFRIGDFRAQTETQKEWRTEGGREEEWVGRLRKLLKKKKKKSAESSIRDPPQWGSCERRDSGRDKWGERGGCHFSEAVTYSLGLAPAHCLIKDIQIALVDLYRGFHSETFLGPTRLQDFEDTAAVRRNSSIGVWEGRANRNRWNFSHTCKKQASRSFWSALENVIPPLNAATIPSTTAHVCWAPRVISAITRPQK